jgi:hypothetical protein
VAEVKNKYRNLVEKTERKSSLPIPMHRRRWDDNIKKDLTEIV